MPSSEYSMLTLRDGFRGVREALIQATLALPADACYRSGDRILLDMVWEPIQETPAWEVLYDRLLVLPGSDLGPSPSWESRRDAMLRRYYHSIEAMIDLTESVSEEEASRPGMRNGQPDDFKAALVRSYVHDFDYLDRLVEDYIPRALALPALPPIPETRERSPSDGASGRRDAAAGRLRETTQALFARLERVGPELAYVPRFPAPIKDLFLHTSNKHKLAEINRRMLTEDNPDLGDIASPGGWWDHERRVLKAQMLGRAASWEALPSGRLTETGTLGGRPYSLVMAIEDTCDAYVSFAAEVTSKLDREGWG